MRFPQRIGIGWSLVLFAVPGLLLWVATRDVVPRLLASGWEPLAAWFAAGGAVMFLLLLAAIAAATISPLQDAASLAERLRLRPLSGSDWRVSLAALGTAIVLTAALYMINVAVWPQLPPRPPFLPAHPLEPARYYLLVLWIPFFVLNIVGEELWWRGFIQSRQEPVFGSSTWMVQGALHAAFHASFGLGVLFVLLPVVFCIPWAAQKTRNTSAAIVVHAGINGPAFLAVNLGAL